MALNVQKKRTRAVVLIEMLLVLPLLLLLIFGMMEYGWAFMNALEIKNAARNGVRVGVTPDATATDITNQVTSTMNAAGLGASGYSLTITPGDPSTLATGDPLTVQVSLAYPNIALFNFPFIPTPTALNGLVTMAKEGP